MPPCYIALALALRGGASTPDPDRGCLMPLRSRWIDQRTRNAIGIACLLLCAGLWSTDARALPGSGAASKVSATDRVALGRALFFDPRLSASGTIDCASCHQPQHAYSDPRPVSIGVFGRHSTRNAPSLENVFVYTHFFWDGRRRSLGKAVLDPLTNPVDMGLANRQAVLKQVLHAGYGPRFAAVFPGAAAPLSMRDISAALSSFVLSLDRSRSPFDRFHDDGDTNALTLQARAGYRLFVGRAGCARCHTVSGHPATLTDNRFHTFWPALRPLTGHLARLTERVMRDSMQPQMVGALADSHTRLSNLGRFLVTHRARSIGAFRTPSLRNVALTAPYMHNGSIATLSGAINEELYYRGLQTGRPIALTARERHELLAFLQSLTIAQPAVPLSAMQSGLQSKHHRE